MSTIVTRAGKGTPLTHNEVDANFTNLNTDKLETSGGTMTGDLSFGDNDKAIFGAGSDLQIYHDGSHSNITDVGTGNLRIRGENLALQNSDSTRNYLFAVNGGATTLYFNNAIRLATTATGVDAAGTFTTNQLTVDNSSGYAGVEVGGSSGGYVDLKSPVTDDYDLRLIHHGNSGSPYNVIDVRSGDLYLATGASALNRMRIENSTGDISFYEDTGTTPKFFWDASAERLGIGNAAPTTALDVTGTVTATAFSGDGASVTNVDAATLGGDSKATILASAQADALALAIALG